MDRNWLTFSLALTCTASLALADDTDDLFSKLDANGDGTVVKDELNEDQIRFFDRLIRVGDKNEDGKLSKDEFKAATNQQTDSASPNASNEDRSRRAREFSGGLFKRFDKNEDGKLSRDEIPEPIKGRMSAFFDRANKDELTQEEFSSQFGGMNRERQPQNREEANQRILMYLKKYDKNEDGKLSRDELPEENRGLGGLFDRLKKDEMTFDEITDVMANARNRGPQGRSPEGRNSEGRPMPEEAPAGRDRDNPNRSRPERMNRPPEGRGPEGRRAPAFLGVLDANKNGKISQKEMLMAGRLFEELDRNKDGELDMPELFGFQGGSGADRGPEGRPGMERDGNRRPQRPEMEGRPEAQKPREGSRPARERPEGERSADNRPGQNGRPSGPPRGISPEQIIERFDENNDGKISKEEAPDRMKAEFEHLDANDDGDISVDEFKAAFERRFGRGGQRQRPEGEKKDDKKRDKDADLKA